MKCLRRNMTDFEYLPYEGMTEAMTEDNEHTGQYQPSYGNAEQKKGNISAPSGTVNQTFYGQDIRYTHVLVMDNPDPGIHENGLIRWKGELYEVRAVLPSLNAVSIALRKQTKDHAAGGD